MSEWNDYINDMREAFEENTKAFDYLPEGWVKSFVPQMRDELFDALGSYAEDFEVIEAKEKWAALRVSWCWSDKDYDEAEIADMNELYDVIENIISKYTDISYNTCIECGEEADSYTRGYVVPVCEECAEV